MNVVLIIFLTLLNGLFAMSEMALASSRKARLLAMQEAGNKGARAALKLLEHPTRFLSTVQIGITSIGVLNGIVGEAAFSAGLAANLQAWGLSASASGLMATAIVVTLITVVTIIFGELVPKRIGQLHPESVACWVSPAMDVLARMTRWLVWLLSVTTQAMLRLLRIDVNAGNTMTQEEISASLEEGVDAGVIEAHEHQMVQNVFGLDERALVSLMVPGADVQWLLAADSIAVCLEIITESGLAEDRKQGGHSWYPVCRDKGLEHVVGVISVARLLELRNRGEDSVGDHVLPAVFLPETLSGLELLEQFRTRATRMVFVVDEYGVVQGIITPRDVLEAITGEIVHGLDAKGWATQREDGSWLIEGGMPITECKARLAIKEDLPLEDRGRYNTVAGLILALHGALPQQGEYVECGGWRFEVVDLDGKRIDKVWATALSIPADK